MFERLCTQTYIWFFFYPLIMFTIPMFLSSTLCSLKEQLSKYGGRKWNWKPIVGAGKRLPREAFSSLRFFPIWAVFRKQSISCKFQAVLLRWGHTRCPEWGNLKRNKLIGDEEEEPVYTYILWFARCLPSQGRPAQRYLLWGGWELG